MTHEPTFADDFTVTQEQADTLNARIAAEKEATPLPEWIEEALQNWKETRPEEYAAMAKRIHDEKQATNKETTMQTTTTTAIERDNAGFSLSGLVDDGTTVFAIIDSVAKSGMSRTMRLFVIQNNEPIFITREVATIIGNKMEKGSMRIRGCGMDMVFATVYELSMAMFDDGYKLKYRTI